MKINPSNKNWDSFMLRVWRILCDSTREILTPLLCASTQVVQARAREQAIPTDSNIWGSSRQNVQGLAGQMVAAPADHALRSQTNALFNACLLYWRKMWELLLLLLPHLVVEVLSWGGGAAGHHAGGEVCDWVPGGCDQGVRSVCSGAISCCSMIISYENKSMILDILSLT